MTRNTHKVETYIQWKIRSGSCSFWWDNWLGVGPLAQFTEDNNRFNNDTVSEFIEEGQWNINKIIQLAPPTQMHNILATQLQLQQGIPDQPVWNLNCNDVFTCTSAWNSIREQRTKTKINTHTWHRNIPFKCSFLLWRALRDMLPTNEKLSSFDIEPADCLCCHPTGVDTIDHIFNAGIFAKKPLLGTSHHKCSSFIPLPLTSHTSNAFTHSGKPTLWQIHSPNTAIKSPAQTILHQPTNSKRGSNLSSAGQGKHGKFQKKENEKN
ncbi:hypothetical protein MTR67_032452 [Solanum verrucosum]|uniref:Reverse transcriptase zinc-binding domain-containing protein n=1 Tax=Solanum verrucosum TaxID=315347 RepID=A0AAF0U496_SOLVR|nr:hypothetical protein MTR67_032452 [Solanum verrucosum]